MPPTDWRALKSKVRIVYLDRDLVVAEKPAGLATVRYHGPDAPRGRGADEPPVLAELLPPLIRVKEGARARKGKSRPLRVVQRLDIGTSGLVVFARTPDAERELGNQFRKHSVIRSYVALVHGDLAAPRHIESFLIDDRGDGLRGSLPGQGAGRKGRGKQAITHVKPLERIGVYTLVECRLETGRTHQIRIHLAEAGHPLCGESVYHRPRFGEAPPDTSGAPRIMLHAGELGFTHPRSKERLRFTQAPPEEFQGFVEGLRAGRPHPPGPLLPDPAFGGTGRRRGRLGSDDTSSPSRLATPFGDPTELAVGGAALRGRPCYGLGRSGDRLPPKQKKVPFEKGSLAERESGVKKAPTASPKLGPRPPSRRRGRRPRGG